MKRLLKKAILTAALLNPLSASAQTNTTTDYYLNPNSVGKGRISIDSMDSLNPFVGVGVYGSFTHRIDGEPHIADNTLLAEVGPNLRDKNSRLKIRGNLGVFNKLGTYGASAAYSSKENSSFIEVRYLNFFDNKEDKEPLNDAGQTITVDLSYNGWFGEKNTSGWVIDGALAIVDERETIPYKSAMFGVGEEDLALAVWSRRDDKNFQINTAVGFDYGWHGGIAEALFDLSKPNLMETYKVKGTYSTSKDKITSSEGPKTLAKSDVVGVPFRREIRREFLFGRLTNSGLALEGRINKELEETETMGVEVAGRIDNLGLSAGYDKERHGQHSFYTGSTGINISNLYSSGKIGVRAKVRDDGKYQVETIASAEF